MKKIIETKGKTHFIKLAKRSYYVIALIITSLIIIKSVDYLNPDFTTGFLSNKKLIFNYYSIAFYLHIFSAPIAILTGFFQFAFYNNKHHKKIGKCYIVFTLFLAAPSGLFMAFYAIGGILSTVNFIALSLLWFYYTYKALTVIKTGDIKKHIHYTISSFILANSAIILRILLYINNQLEIFTNINGYIICAILSWLPWLLIYQLLLRKHLVNSFFRKTNNTIKA